MMDIGDDDGEENDNCDDGDDGDGW